MTDDQRSCTQVPELLANLPFGGLHAVRLQGTNTRVIFTRSGVLSAFHVSAFLRTRVEWQAGGRIRIQISGHSSP